MFKDTEKKNLTQAEQDEYLAKKYTGSGITTAIDHLNRAGLVYQNPLVKQPITSIPKPAAATVHSPLASASLFKPAVPMKPVTPSNKTSNEIDITSQIQQHLDNPQALLNYIQSLKP